jgi:hypothetical protein
MAVEVWRERAYVMGGEDLVGRQVLATTQRYDPTLDRWERLADLPEPVHGVASSVVGDAIVLFGGSRVAASGQGTTTVQRFEPPPN